MPPFPPPSHAPLAITLIIAMAALIALAMLLRWHHDRQRLAILKLAIEKGVPHLPTTLPMWLSSLRQGIMLTTLGVALLIVGGAAVIMVHSPMASRMSSPRPSPLRMLPMVGPPVGGEFGPVTMPGGGGARRGAMPGQGHAPADLLPPAAGNAGHPLAPLGSLPPHPGFRAGNGRFPPRGRLGANGGFNPMMARGFPPRRGYQQRLLGLGALASGLILTLLGAARIGFAMVERRYSSAEELPFGDFPSAPDEGA